MAIQFRCPHCQRLFSVRDDLAGRTGTCNGCNKRLVVPTPSQQPPRPPQVAQHPEERPEPPPLHRPAPLPQSSSSGLLKLPTKANEDDTGSFPQGVSGADSSKTVAKGGHKGPFNIDVSSRVPTHSQATIEAIQGAVWTHLSAAGADVFWQADLRLSILRCDPGSRVLRYLFPPLAGAARVSIAVSGTVNGVEIDETANAARFVGVFGGSSEAMLDACFQECTGDVLSALHRVAGRKASSYSQIWSKMQLAKWFAFAVVLIGYAILYALVQMPRSRIESTGLNLLLLAFISFMASVGVFGVIAMSALVCAPTDFLKSDPRGIKVMWRSGTKSVIALRVIGVVIGLVAGAVFLLAVWTLFDRSCDSLAA